MKKLLISGYYGFNNFGDEAILGSLVSAIREKSDDFKITIISNDPQKTKSLYNSDAISRLNAKEILSDLIKCDIFISGGGSLFQDVTSLKSLLYYISLVFLAKIFRKKVYIIAQGIGPLNTKLGNFLTKYILKSVDYITLRDSKSKKIINDWNIESTLTSDLVWLSPSKVKFAPPSNTIGIQLREWKNFDENKLKIIAKTIINNFNIEKYSFKVISLHKEQDYHICKRFMRIASLLNPNIKIEMVDTENVLENIDIISSLDFLIGVRYHAGLVAIKEAVPTMMLSYDPKVEALCEDSQIPYISIENFSKPAFEVTLKKLINNKIDLKEKMEKYSSIMKKRSRQNIDLLIKI